MQENNNLNEFFLRFRNDWLVGLFVFILIPVVLTFNTHTTYHQHFSILAISMLQGRLDIPSTALPYYDGVDVVAFQEKYYWHLGLLPAVLLLPVSLLGLVFGFFPYQSYVNILLVFVVFITAAKLSKLVLKCSFTDSLWLALLFCFGTVAVLPILVPFSWYFSQFVAMSLLLVAFYLQLTKSHPLLKNILLGLSLLTRFQLLPALIVFPVLYWLFNDRDQIKDIGYFLICVMISCIMVGFYNFVRFEDVLDFGHSYANMHAYNQVVEKTGTFSLVYLPRNFYEYFLRGPVFMESEEGGIGVFPYVKPSELGLSVFLITPLLFLIFINIKWNMFNKVVGMVGILPSLIMYLLYASTGSRTFGPRYLIDVLPYVFFLLLQSLQFHKKLTWKIKTIIALSIMCNIYLLSTWQI